MTQLLKIETCGMHSSLLPLFATIKGPVLCKMDFLYFLTVSVACQWSALLWKLIDQATCHPQMRVVDAGCGFVTSHICHSIHFYNAATVFQSWLQTHHEEAPACTRWLHNQSRTCDTCAGSVLSGLWVMMYRKSAGRLQQSDAVASVLAKQCWIN